MVVTSGNDNDLALWKDPQRERLLVDLAAVNEELAVAKLDLADLELRLRAFAAFHDRLLAPLYATLDDVKARIAELLADRSGSEQDREEAVRARERARLSAQAAEQATAEQRGPNSGFVDEPPKPRPSDRARRLFRALIKLCHPDLAGDDAERLRREQFTRQVNDAYASNDLDRLDQLSRQWGGQGRAQDGSPRPPADLGASVHAARAELWEVRAEIAALGATGLGRLLLQRDDPVGAVRSVAERTRDEIRRQREVLRSLASR
jgi:hypothetical protein